MSDDVKTSTAKGGKRKPRIILVVNNPDPYSHQPSSTPNQSLSDASYAGPSPHPPPLTTNLPDVSRPYPSSHSNPSNPALSSPSSTSSRAFESTPPPSTPGQSSHPDDLSSEGTLRQEPVIVPYPDGSDLTPPSGISRPTGLLSRFRPPLPRPSHGRRSSNNRPATVSR
jgi:hypothetical protein